MRRCGPPIRGAERAARNRVQRAKVGLGERGTPWWEQPSAERRARWERAVAEIAEIAEAAEIAEIAEAAEIAEIAEAAGGDAEAVAED